MLPISQGRKLQFLTVFAEQEARSQGRPLLLREGRSDILRQRHEGKITLREKNGNFDPKEHKPLFPPCWGGNGLLAATGVQSHRVCR